MSQEQGSSGEVQWFRLASRVCRVIARIRSAQASPVVPDYYCCPLSGDWIVDPVMTPHGQSYERSFIEEAIRRFGVDPLTRHPLSLADLVPNRNLQEAIRDFQMHFLTYAVPYNIAS
jgi:STIP1 family protein 1